VPLISAITARLSPRQAIAVLDCTSATVWRLPIRGPFLLPHHGKQVFFEVRRDFVVLQQRPRHCVILEATVEYVKGGVIVVVLEILLKMLHAHLVVVI
jgi:hypothetical protein